MVRVIALRIEVLLVSGDRNQLRAKFLFSILKTIVQSKNSNTKSHFEVLLTRKLTTKCRIVVRDGKKIVNKASYVK